MYIVKTKYSLENNIEPLAMLKKASELDVNTLLVADDGPYAWLEIDKWNKKYNINVLYSIRKDRSGVSIIWIPRGDVLRKIAKLEKAYRTDNFNEIAKTDFLVLLVPNEITKKEILQKDIDTLNWLKKKTEQLYILNRKEAFHNIRILKEKTGIHSISMKEVMYLDPIERDVSLMRKAIKNGKLEEDDYRSFMLPKQHLEREMESYEYKRTERFLESIEQKFVVEGHPEFKDKRMEYWNTKEIENAKMPDKWGRFFGKEIKLPETEWERKKLALLCYKAGYGFNRRYVHPDMNIQFALESLKHELSVIAEKGFYTYFLMVEDFIRFCREKKIRVGKGRGSVVGSVLAFCLGITDIDPVKYGLKFERFLNPYRLNTPDIDLDFPPSQIDMVFKYVEEKYGEENVSKILTFNTFGVINAIQSIKNVFRIKDRIETWFPQGLENLDEFLQSDEGKLVKSRLKEKGYTYILDYVNGISNLPQALSIHPAGVIISQELDELPVIERDGNQVLAFTKQDDQIERLGVIKFDFLKIKTLDVLKQTEEIRKKLNKPIYELNYADEKTFETYRSGNTVGVFQMKSYGMRKTCQDVKPNNIEELMDILSLYRPGPMEEIPKYIENKEKGSWSFEKLDPNSSEFKDIVPILGKTHGIITYQEQIMEIASVWAGYSLGEADLLRRAISEKKKSIMEAEKKIFIERSVQNGRDKSVTEYIYFLIERFAEYGFNRSHAGGYAVFSFETAFDKTHYPIEFMTASMNVSISDRKRLKIYLKEVERMGIELLKPDLYESDVYFTATQDGKIRMGLAAIGGIGPKQAELLKKIVKEHKPKTFEEFYKNKQLGKLSGRTMDILIRAGVFDLFGDRYEIWQSVKDKKNQKPLDGKNPITFYMEWEQQLLQCTFSDFNKIAKDLKPDEFVVESISKIKDKKGRKMAFLKVISSEGKKELVVYYNVWSYISEKLEVGMVIIPKIKDNNVVTYVNIKGES